MYDNQFVLCILIISLYYCVLFKDVVKKTFEEKKEDVDDAATNTKEDLVLDDDDVEEISIEITKKKVDVISLYSDDEDDAGDTGKR